MKKAFKIILIATLVIAFGLAEYNFNLEDINPSSSTYGQEIGPASFAGIVPLYYFGHQN